MTISSSRSLPDDQFRSRSVSSHPQWRAAIGSFCHSRCRSPSQEEWHAYPYSCGVVTDPTEVMKALNKVSRLPLPPAVGCALHCTRHPWNLTWYVARTQQAHTVPMLLDMYEEYVLRMLVTYGSHTSFSYIAGIRSVCVISSIYAAYC